MLRSSVNSVDTAAIRIDFAPVFRRRRSAQRAQAPAVRIYVASVLDRIRSARINHTKAAWVDVASSLAPEPRYKTPELGERVYRAIEGRATADGAASVESRHQQQQAKDSKKGDTGQRRTEHETLLSRNAPRRPSWPAGRLRPLECQEPTRKRKRDAQPDGVSWSWTRRC